MIKAKVLKKVFVDAWHVVQKRGVLAYGDHREVKEGHVYSTDFGEGLVMCKRGLHGSKTPKLALQHFKKAHPKAKGPFWLCHVILFGKILGPYKNKFCAQRRLVMSMKKIR